jgi:NAD-dependent deacetylase
MPEMETDAAARASTSCEVFLSIGTSTVVDPAASLPFEAIRCAATLVEINPQPTPLTPQSHYVLQGAAGQLGPELLAGLRAIAVTAMGES